MSGRVRRSGERSRTAHGQSGHPVRQSARDDGAASAPAPDVLASEALTLLLDDALAHQTTAVGVTLPQGAGTVLLPLTSLDQIVFPYAARGARTKGDLLRYHAAVAPVMVPHLVRRPVVMTHYPKGASGAGIFVHRAPVPRPAWVSVCRTAVRPPKVVDYVTIDSLAALVWCVNRGAVVFHPWHTRCDAPALPDVLVFDLDPVPGVRFARVRSAALVARDALAAWGLPAFVKTSGATGLHLVVPLLRELDQRAVRDVARDLAMALEREHPRRFTTVERVARRPPGTVLLDYGQNAPGHTLASAYSVRASRSATVSAPLTWEELEDGAHPRDFTLVTMPRRVAEHGDPWRMVHEPAHRTDLARWRERLLGRTPRRRAG